MPGIERRSGMFEANACLLYYLSRKFMALLFACAEILSVGGEILPSSSSMLVTKVTIIKALGRYSGIWRYRLFRGRRMWSWPACLRITPAIWYRPFRRHTSRQCRIWVLALNHSISDVWAGLSCHQFWVHTAWEGCYGWRQLSFSRTPSCSEVLSLRVVL